MANGSETRGTLVLLHGSADTERCWAGVMARLPEWRCVAPSLVRQRGERRLEDAIGGGRAEGWGEDALDRDGEWLEALLERERPVATIGHSYGALLTLHALRRGAPVGRVALFEPIAFGLVPDPDVVHAMMDGFFGALAEGRRREALRGLVDYWNGAGSLDALPGPMADRLEAGLAHTAAEVLAGRRDETGPSDLERLRGALILCGAESTAESLAVSARLGEAAGGWRALAGAGHQFPRTHPEEVAAAVSAWLDA